jgi:hypothetical protein
MKSYQDILQIVNDYHELGETIEAANFIIEEYGLRHPNLKGFELREKAKPEYILMTTEGMFGEQQIIRIPENAFEFPLELIIILIAHEMVHVHQKAVGFMVDDRNEREWQAYYEMLFRKIYPQIPEVSNFQKKFFANKALDYYKRMGENSVLQIKYETQKKEVDNLLTLLEPKNL